MNLFNYTKKKPVQNITIAFGGFLAVTLFTSASLGDHWIFNDDGNYMGLYRYYFLKKYGTVDDLFPERMHSIACVRLLSILPCILSFYVLVLPLLQRFKKICIVKHALISLYTATMSMLLALITYTIQPRMLQQSKWGWCYITAWFSSFVIPVYTLAIFLLPDERKSRHGENKEIDVDITRLS